MLITKFILLVTAVFAIYANVFSFLPPIVIRGVFCGFIMIIIFLNSYEKKKYKGILAIIDLFFIIIILFSTLFLILEWENFAMGIHSASTLEIGVAIVMILLVLEATRRAIGFVLPLVSGLFLLYAFFGNYAPGILVSKSYSLERVTSFLFWSTDGIYGLPMYIASSYVILFIIFGSFLLKSKGDKWFINISYAIFGKFRGGPALSAILCSALFGMISGSPVANVATTGSFTIPLMKESGYKKHVAGAVGAVASTGGMFTPPIMGAAAFIMAEYVGVNYISVVLAAIIPAIIFYLTLMLSSYLNALKTGISSVPKEKIPNLIEVLKNYGHLIPPVFILVYLILSGTSLMWAAFYSIVALLVLAMIRKNTRMTFSDIVNALIDSTKNSISVAIACASAGIIFGVISLTGLGFRVSSILLAIGGSNSVIILLMAAFISLLLGFAMPPTAVYLVVAALVAPSLTELGFSVIASHMFLFFYSCIGAITPPVALAAYAAAGIAGSDPNQTGFTAFKMGFSTYVIPILFIYNPELLLIGNAIDILWIFLKVLIGMAAFASLLEGYLFHKLSYYIRLTMLALVLMIFYNNLYLNIIGIIILLMIVYFIYHRDKIVRKNKTN